MTSNDKKHNRDPKDDQEEDSGEGSGGSSEQVEFRYHETLSTGPREDTRPPSEDKRLMAVHKDIHLARVKKQNETRKERLAIKEGRFVVTAENYRKYGAEAGGGGSMSKFKKHRLADRAQFSGMDKQVIGLPSENEAETNPEQKAELENRLENKLTLRNQNRYTPKPRPF